MTVSEKLRQTLPSIAQKESGGDNLSILLASYFEPSIEDDELDEHGTWKQGAIDATNAVLDAIHAHYSEALSTVYNEGFEEGMKRAAWLFDDDMSINEARKAILSQAEKAK